MRGAVPDEFRLEQLRASWPARGATRNAPTATSCADVGFGIKRLDDDGTDALFGLVARLDDTAVMTRFAAQLAAARQPALLDRLFVALEGHGVLDSLDVHAERGYEKLAVALETWRRSRGE
ncbi:hypothetical protein ACFY8W_35030 [Streptomyces sp. NPDC012637]|uniref:hypothetical protein n=1 Tax=Streptomyces sp. NPDC012637 TaxID=3364842 RepID=UPI0036E6B487